jgi:hypothetical protein
MHSSPEKQIFQIVALGGSAILATLDEIAQQQEKGVTGKFELASYQLEGP